jgi:hypothetical protein
MPTGVNSLSLWVFKEKIYIRLVILYLSHSQFHSTLHTSLPFLGLWEETLCTAPLGCSYQLTLLGFNQWRQQLEIKGLEKGEKFSSPLPSCFVMSMALLWVAPALTGHC